MRRLVYEALTQQASLTSLVPAEAWYELGAVTDTPQQRPFVILKGTGMARTVGRLSTLEIWCYDDRGDYTRIDDFQRAVRAFFAEMTERTRVRGDGSVVRLVAADWQGDSADLYDDVFRCGTRYSSWRLVGSGQ